MGAWSKYVLGWIDPEVVPYGSKRRNVMLGQSAKVPAGTEPAVKIELPDKVVTVGEPAALPPHHVEPSAEEQVVANDATTRALELVSTLPPAQAEMVMLRVVAGLEVADVATLVNKKPGAVRVAVHRALQTLARHPDARADREVV